MRHGTPRNGTDNCNERCSRQISDLLSLRKLFASGPSGGHWSPRESSIDTKEKRRRSRQDDGSAGPSGGPCPGKKYRLETWWGLVSPFSFVSLDQWRETSPKVETPGIQAARPRSGLDRATQLRSSHCHGSCAALLLTRLMLTSRGCAAVGWTALWRRIAWLGGLCVWLAAATDQHSHQQPSHPSRIHQPSVRTNVSAAC